MFLTHSKYGTPHLVNIDTSYNIPDFSFFREINDNNNELVQKEALMQVDGSDEVRGR